MNQNRRRPENWKAPFFSIWTGQAFSLAGSNIVQFALVWWLTERTGSATVLATASLVALLPQILLGPIAGAYVDRWNRRLVMILADGVVALATVWLVFLFWAGAIETWHVFVAMFIRSLGGSFHWPAMQASTSLMVPEEHLARVAGVNQTLNGALNIAGPPLGALLMSLLPLYGVLLVDVGTAALAIAPLLFVRIPQPVRYDHPAGGLKPSVWTDLRQGLRYIWRWQGLVVLIAAAMIVKIALTPAFALLPLLVRQYFGGDAAQLSLMEAVAGIGIVAGGLLLGVWGGFKRKVFTIFIGLGVLAVGWLSLAVTPSAWFTFALGCAFVIGLSIPLVDGPVMAIMQATVAPEMQGRVFMLMGSLISVTSPFGLAIAGPVSDFVGLQAWYMAAGAVCGIMAVAGFFIPALVHIEENGKGPRQATSPLPVEVQL